ncbi:MAG: Gfo/Idh/MocA family oxidoreductase [Oribacterium sp.]|jgi:predicted dehydrogenase|nr:Gfo/Idh/MocA family oxidoreductase [Oribacterium sp.]
MKKYTVAVAGLGVRGKIHIHGLLENPERFEIVGLCDINANAMQEVAEANGLQSVPQFTDVEEMLKTTKPEVFCFCLLPDQRLNMIKLAVKYGVKGISLEKPVAESLQEAKEMVDLCKEHHIKAIVCHQQKYLSQFQRMKARIDHGEIGTIRKIHVETTAWYSQLGTHYVDYILWINGGYKARWVCGHVHGPICLDDTHPAPDYLMGTMELENGTRAYVECGYLSERHNPTEYASSDNRLTVYGTDGYCYMETDGFFGICSSETGGHLIEGKDPGWRYHQQVPIQTPYYTEYADWLDDDTKIHSCNIETAYHGFEILEGMCLSALRNVRIDLPIQDLSYTPVIEQMRAALPACDSEKISLFLGHTIRKEREVDRYH